MDPNRLHRQAASADSEIHLEFQASLLRMVCQQLATHIGFLVQIAELERLQRRLPTAGRFNLES